MNTNNNKYNHRNNTKRSNHKHKTKHTNEIKWPGGQGARSPTATKVHGLRLPHILIIMVLGPALATEMETTRQCSSGQTRFYQHGLKTTPDQLPNDPQDGATVMRDRFRDVKQVMILNESSSRGCFSLWTNLRRLSYLLCVCVCPPWLNFSVILS